ncbi:hypothetical protein FQ008_24685, partial [Escherichia coli]|nr:hypothetical protein [Escherichia coli]
SGRILENVLLFNSLMLLLYMFPFVLAVWFCVRVIKTASSSVQWVKGRDLEEAIMLLPDTQVEKVVYA